MFCQRGEESNAAINVGSKPTWAMLLFGIFLERAIFLVFFFRAEKLKKKPRGSSCSRLSQSSLKSNERRNRTKRSKTQTNSFFNLSGLEASRPRRATHL